MSSYERSVKIACGCLMTALLAGGCQPAPKKTMTTEPGRTAEPAPQRTRQAWPQQRGGAMEWSAMAFPTGEASTSVVGVEKGMPDEVRVNRPFSYEMVVTNLSGRSLRDVVVSDDCSAGFKMSGSQPQGEVGQDGVLRWGLGAMGPNESKTIKVSGVPTAEGTIRSCTAVAYDSLLCATSAVIQPKVQLTKSGPTSAMSCDEMEYCYRITNSGSGTAKGLVITDTLPDGLVSVDTGKVVRHQVGDLAAGETKSFCGAVKAARTGRFASKARVNGEDVTAESNELATTITTPKLTVAVNCAGKQYVGRPSKIEIVVKNTGDAPSQNTILTSPMGQNAKFMSASDGGRESRSGVEWNLGNLAPNASRTVTLNLGANQGGMLRASASVKGKCAATASDSCQVEYQGIPAILLEVVDVEDPIEVGQNETYVITATNQGSAPDTNIRIICTLEDNMQYVSASGATDGRLEGNKIVFEPLGTLAPRRKATWQVVVRAQKAGDTRFGVDMETDQLTRPVSETEATNLY